MILISLQPFDVKKICALVAAMICLSTVSGFAQSLMMSVPATPYDRQMTRIQPVLFTKAASHNTNVSLVEVNDWIQDLRAQPYAFSPEWKTPEEVEKAPTADCKGKAVALYQRMRENGATNVRLIIGKRSWSSQKTHAWLEWTTEGGSYVLDPTINWAAYPAQRVGTRAYIPFYAYSGARKVSRSLLDNALGEELTDLGWVQRSRCGQTVRSDDSARFFLFYPTFSIYPEPS